MWTTNNLKMMSEGSWKICGVGVGETIPQSLTGFPVWSPI